MKTLIKTIHFIALGLLCIGLASNAAYAQDPATLIKYVLDTKMFTKQYLAGEETQENKLRRICTDSKIMALQEQARLDHNDFFHEIETEEQKQDIITLNEAMKKADKDCDASIKLWDAYDDKWYAKHRHEKLALLEKLEKEWPLMIEDTGEDILDVVINGALFSIPRKYIWFGSRKPDGVSDGVNLEFVFDDLGPSKNGLEDSSVTIGVLLTASRSKREYCVEKQEEKCTSWNYNGFFHTKAFNCRPGETISEKYKAFWREDCLPKEGSGKVFDEELGMWRIGKAAHYEGSWRFPNIWLLCGRPDSDWKPSRVPQCKSAVRINNNTIATYSFPQRQGFWRHREIQKRIQDKLQSFFVKETDYNFWHKLDEFTPKSHTKASLQ